MEETKIEVKLEAHEHEIGSLKHRVEELELQNRSIQKLDISVSKMAVNVENMLRELNKQGERMEMLKRVPTETGKLIKAAIITALVSGVIVATVTAVITLL